MSDIEHYWYTVFKASCHVHEDPSQFWYVVTEYGWDEGIMFCPFCKTHRDTLDSLNEDEHHSVAILGDFTLADIMKVMTPYPGDAKELIGE